MRDVSQRAEPIDTIANDPIVATSDPMVLLGSPFAIEHGSDPSVGKPVGEPKLALRLQNRVATIE